METTDRELLRYLLRLANTEGGWRRKGLWGWRFGMEVGNELSWDAAQRLPALVYAGMVEHLTAAELGSRRPLSLFRVSAAGARALPAADRAEAARLRTEPGEDESPGPVYLHVGGWRLLDALVRRRHTGLGPLRFGEAGWMTGLELSRATRRAVGTDHLRAMERAGLLARRLTGVERAKHRVAYRATDRGASAEARAAPVRHEGSLYVEMRIREDGA